MPKISRKEFKKTNFTTIETAQSFIKFVDHCKLVHKFFMDKIEKLENRVAELEPKPQIENKPVATPESQGSFLF